MGLEYLHSKNIIHRDIKPENIVFDEEGYLYISDFGISKVRREENSQDTSGTPGYMAPEVLFHNNHSFGVDYYAVGVILYEIMVGSRPFLVKKRDQLREELDKG